jgi:hypothetical protein
MNTQFKIFLFCTILLASLPSCMVSKCRYSSGWNLGLNRGEECHTKQATKNSKISARQAIKSSQAVLIDSAFTNTFYSHSSFTADLSNAYVIALSPSTIAPQGYLKTQIDSGKTTQKSKKKKRNLLSRFLLNDYGSYTNSANDGLVYILLICFFIVTAIIWGIYSLIRLIVRAHRKKAAQINTATVSPKSSQSLGAKDSDEKLRDQNPQTTFAVNSVAKPAIEQPESTDEVADVKKGKKSKVEKLASVICLVIILASLGYGLIDLLQRLFN